MKAISHDYPAITLVTRNCNTAAPQEVCIYIYMLNASFPYLRLEAKALLTMVLFLGLDVTKLLGARVFIFDFDGVLVDSYSCLPAIYRLIAEKLNIPESMIEAFVDASISREDEEDYRMNYNRLSWWPELLDSFGVKLSYEELRRLAELYQMERIRRSKILPKVKEILDCLRDMGKILVIVAGSDGIRGEKKKRIEASGLAQYFNEIIIVGDNVPTREEAIRLVLNKYGVKQDEVVVIDDKPQPINTVKRAFPDIFAVRVNFETILRKAWIGDAMADATIGGLYELFDILIKYC